jgi:hypothetical protein
MPSAIGVHDEEQLLIAQLAFQPCGHLLSMPIVAVSLSVQIDRGAILKA